MQNWENRDKRKVKMEGNSVTERKCSGRLRDSLPGSLSDEINFLLIQVHFRNFTFSGTLDDDACSCSVPSASAAAT